MTERSEKIDRKEKIETVSWNSGIDIGVMRYDVPAVCASKISGILWNDHCRRNVCRSFCGSGSFSESGSMRSISGKDAKDREGFWYAFVVGRNFFCSGNCRSLYFLLFSREGIRSQPRDQCRNGERTVYDGGIYHSSYSGNM